MSAYRADSDVLGEVRPGTRDWRTIGIGLVSAFALVGLYGAAMWSLAVIVEALL